MCFVVSLRVPVDVPSSRAAPLRQAPRLWALDYWPITHLSSPVVASPRTTPLFSGSRLQPKSSRATFGCSTTNSGASKTLKYQVAVAVQSTLPRWPTSTRTWHSTSTITPTTRSLTSPFSTPTWLRRVRARWISNRFAPCPAAQPPGRAGSYGSQTLCSSLWTRVGGHGIEATHTTPTLSLASRFLRQSPICLLGSLQQSPEPMPT